MIEFKETIALPQANPKWLITLFNPASTILSTYTHEGDLI